MSDEWQVYAKDSRTICKYGAKCYQKNPEHQKTYKHPPQNLEKKVDNRHNNRYKPYYKKRKPEAKGVNKDICKNDDEASTSDIIDKKTLKTKEDQIVIEIPETVTFYEKDVDHSLFKELFLLEMPPDFFNLFECLQKDSESVEKVLSNVNLELIGPYDLLLGKLPVLDDKELYLIHWRFYYDPPEFQAVLKVKGKSQFHIGYFRDNPEATPAFLASNDSSKDCNLKPLADNIFGAVYIYLQNQKKQSPFTAMACQKLMDKIKTWAEEHKYSVEEYNMKTRLSQIVTHSMHGAGIVVPYNKKTQLGYRKLVDTDANIRKLFKKLEEATSQSEKEKFLSELQPVITYANIAVDECDFGTGLEAGINLFCSGLKELQSTAVSCLTAAYSLLNRETFSKIIQIHMKYRRKGANMSLMSSSDQ